MTIVIDRIIFNPIETTKYTDGERQFLYGKVEVEYTGYIKGGFKICGNAVFDEMIVNVTEVEERIRESLRSSMEEGLDVHSQILKSE